VIIKAIIIIYIHIHIHIYLYIYTYTYKWSRWRWHFSWLGVDSSIYIYIYLCIVNTNVQIISVELHRPPLLCLTPFFGYGTQNDVSAIMRKPKPEKATKWDLQTWKCKHTQNDHYYRIDSSSCVSGSLFFRLVMHCLIPILWSLVYRFIHRQLWSLRTWKCKRNQNVV